MKNILFIVLDSITNDQLFNSSSSKLKAPFLTKLREKAISGDKMYSQAPYTEAALMSLLGSLDTLDNGGYIDKFKDKKTVIDVFNENGYTTFFPTYYPSIYPKYMDYGAEVKFYIEKFTPTHFWDYRFSHFQKYYLNNETSNEENKMLEDMLEDNLNAWINFLNLLISNSETTKMINNCIDRDILDDIKTKVSLELSKFCKNKSKYLMELFRKGLDHRLFKIEDQKYIDKIHSNDFRSWFINNYKTTFDRINCEQIKRNRKNAKIPFGKIVRNINDIKTVKGLLAGYKNLIHDKDLYDRINNNFDLFKAQRSFRTVANLTIDWIDKNKKDPWMAYVHVDDAHYPENFFTYDTDDKEIVIDEFKKINDFLDNLPKNYCGTIASDLSLLYCDSIIEMIFNYLKKSNLLSNTSVVITADHGFSYYFNPIREKYVISNYRENYNVPFIVYDKDVKPRIIKDFLATKDIPATLLDLASIKKPDNFKGESLLTFNGRKYATVEYMGGGCPDIKRRPIILGIRDDNYEVMSEIFNGQLKVSEIYDSKKDYKEQKNLVNKTIDISDELKFIENRYKEIIKDFNDNPKSNYNLE